MAKLIEITGKAISGEWGNDDESGTGIPVLRTTNFTNSGVIDYSKVVTREIKKKNIESKYLRYGDIIIEKSGGSDTQPVGRVVFFEGEENKYLFNNFTGLLRVTDQNICFPRYLFYVLFCNYQRGGTIPFQNKTTGLHNLKTDDYVKKCDIPLPPLEEQRKIAANLDKATHLMDLCNAILEKLDLLVKARFVEMFGDPETNEKEWSRKIFKDICSVRQGLQIPISERLTEKLEDCFEYITVAYLHGGKEREYIKSPKKTVICTEDDILMTRTGNTGMVVSGVCGVFHNNFFLIDYDKSKFEKIFLIHYLESNYIQAEIIKRAGTSTIPDLNHGDFYKIPIYEPPLELQEQFATFVAQTDKTKAAVQQVLQKAETLKKALMQEYFG